MFNSLTTFDFFPSLPIGVTKLDGPDNRQFLQGQLTCELDDLTPAHSQLAAHCDAKGKMVASLRLIDNSEVILALQAQENTASHLPLLAKYAVFSKVTITDATDEYHCSGLAGVDAEKWIAEQLGVSLTASNAAANTDIGSIIRVDSELAPRFIIVSTPSQYNNLTAQLHDVDHVVHASSVWQALECANGVSQIVPQTQGDFVPQMHNLQMTGAINFKKGCYIGQETVARMHFRGLNKRGMFVLQSSSHIDCNVGDSVEKQLGESWRNAGTLINVAHVNNQTIACAVLPTDVDLAMKLRVKDNNDGVLTISKPAYFIES